MRKVNKKRCAALLVLTAMAAGGGFIAGKAFGADDHIADATKMVKPYVEAEQSNTGLKIVLNDMERDMVERVVAAEARGESFEGQAAVAEVIYNRCVNRGLTVKEVIWQEKQFAYPYSGEISGETKEAVAAIFDYGLLNLDGAEYFHADRMIPYWAKDMQEVCHIGGHIFYKEAE